MALLIHSRTNNAVQRDCSLHYVLVVHRLRRFVWRPSMRARLGAVQWGWRKRTLKQDAWADAKTALRYPMWEQCKRSKPCIMQRSGNSLRTATRYRKVCGVPDTINTVLYTRPYRFKRFPSQRIALACSKSN